MMNIERCIVSLFVLSLLSVSLLPETSEAQIREVRAAEIVLDDNGGGGTLNRLRILPVPDITSNETLLIPNPGGAANFLLSESSGTQTIGADMTFTGTIDFSGATVTGIAGGGSVGTGEPFLTTTASATLTAERILTAGTGVTVTDGGANSPMTVAIGQSVATTATPTFGAMTLNGNLTMNGNDITSNANLDLTSDASVIVNIDEDNSGTGASFSVETNGAAADLFAVTEAGLATVTSNSGTGGLRVRNTNAGGTTDILTVMSGAAAATTQLTVDRNGDVGIGIGAATPDARVEVENNSAGDPTLLLRNGNANGVGLEIEEGSVVAGVVQVAAAGTIPNNAVIVEALGPTVVVPTGGDDGQIIYVVNTTAGITNVSGLANDGGAVLFRFRHSIPRGGAATIIRVGGSWYAVDRN